MALDSMVVFYLVQSQGITKDCRLAGGEEACVRPAPPIPPTRTTVFLHCLFTFENECTFNNIECFLCF